MNSEIARFNISVDDIVLAPGEATPVRVRLQNVTDEQLLLSFELWGLESDWYTLPGPASILEANAIVDLELVITIPRSYPAATLPVTLRVTAVGSTTSSRSATLSITIGDARSMSARLEPSEIEGRHVGVFRVVLRNRGQQPEHYTLSSTTTSNGLRIHFDNPKPLILPGQEGSVTARVTTRRRLTGSVQRHPFAIVARGRTRPVELTAAFVSRPELGSRTSKVAVLLAVLLVWGALASIGISAFDSSLHRRAVAAQTIPNQTTRATTTATNKNGSQKGSSPSSSTSSSSSTSTKSPTAANAQNVTLVGTVGGSSPGGVQVTATPVATTAPATAANISGQSPSSNGGMVYVNASSVNFNAAANTQLGPQVTTYTAPDGAYVLAGLKSGVSYLITFSKPGFTTHKVLLPSPHSGQQVSLSVTLVPGTGTLSGAVRGPNGPLGNAKVTVSNGLLNFTTHTSSTGSGIGDWTVSQLSTPGSYLVQVSAAGFGTQVTTVTLGPSASKSNVNTTLSANVGSITGVISSATTNQPLGGASITATDGVQTVTATSFTVGKVGAYALPNLAIPANWIVTIGGSGYQTQTEDINLNGNTTVNTVLSQSGGNLTGTITLPSTTGNNATTTIGLILSDGSQIYKTLSTSRSPGSSTVQYQFPQVLPGVYTLTAEGFGFTTSSTNVTLTAGATTTSNLTLSLAPAGGLDDATITGTVTSAVGGVLASVPIELNGTQVTTTNSNGSYTINNVAPGVATITAVGTKVTTTYSNGYTTQSQQIDVASGSAATAPTIVLGELSSISGQFLDALNNEPIGQASIPGCNVTSASVQLTQNSKVIASASATSADDYSFTGVAPGNYILKASATCFESTQIAVDITNGQNLTQQLELSTTPTYAVLVQELVNSANGSPLPEPVANACVTLSPKGSSSGSIYAQTESNGVAGFANLTLGATYSVEIAQYANPPSSCASHSASPIATQATSFTAEPNGSTNSIFLTPQFQSFQVGLSFPFIDVNASGSVVDCSVGDGSANSSACPTVTNSATSISVTLSGISGYQASSLTGQLQRSSIAATPSTSTSGMEVWSFPSSALTGLISTSAVLHVTAPGFEAFSKPINIPIAGGSSSTSITGTSITELLTPTPVSVSVSAPSGLSTLAVQPGTITPDETTNTLSSTTSIAINPSGATYNWTDPATGHSSGYAEPGIYQVSGSGTGVELVPETVSVGLCSSSSDCAAQSLDLTNTTLTITPKNLPSLSTNSASAALICDLGSTTPTPLGSPISFTSPVGSSQGGSVEFAGLTTSSSSSTVATVGCSSGSYLYQITLDGVLTYQTVNAVTTSSTRTPTLTYIEGTLEGSPYTNAPTSPIPNTSIYICAASATGACSSSKKIASGTSSANGKFVIPSTATVSGSTVTNSLSSSTTYAIGVSSSAGYQQPTVTITPDQPSTTIQLIATPVTQTLNVSTGSSAAKVTVTPTTTTSGLSVAAQTVTSSCASQTCTASFSFELPPTQWTFAITASGYTSSYLGPLSYEAGSEPGALSATLTQDTSTVGGTVYVSATATSPSSTPIGGLTLTLSATSTNSTFKPETTTTGTDGSYQFSGAVPTGSYDITVASTSGYLEQTPVSFATNFPNPTIDNFTVYAPAEALNVTIKSPSGVSSSDLAGATVTLTADTAATTPISCSSGDKLRATPPAAIESAQAAQITTKGATSYVASFASVPPDVYTISVSNADMPTPAQITPSTIDLCPSETGSQNPSVNQSVTIDQGELTGTVTVNTPNTTASSTQVTISATAGSNSSSTSCTANYPSPNNSSSTQQSCTYQLYLTSGVTYAVTAIASGYVLSSPSPSATFTSSTSTGTQDFELTFTEVSGEVTVTPSSTNASSSTPVTITATPPTGSSSGIMTASCTATVPTGSSGTTQSCSYQLYYLSYGVGYTIKASASGYTPSPRSVPFTPTSSSPTESQDFQLSS